MWGVVRRVRSLLAFSNNTFSGNGSPSIISMLRECVIIEMYVSARLPVCSRL